MNKVLVLREKYPKINQKTFDMFVESDKTPTKKYLSYMLKMWSGKKSTSITAERLANYVSLFDELLPFIENKDIYSPYYDGYGMLVETVETAKETKEEKTFVRDENALVLLETDDFIFLSPKTYRGSLKYGYGTKWCTASRSSPNYFKNYTDKGALCYLIDKNGDKINYTSKVAFYMESLDGNELQKNFLIYNEIDKTVTTTQLYNSNWAEESIFFIITYFRKYAYDTYLIKDAKNNVKTVVNAIKKVDMDLFMNSIKFLEKAENGDYSKEREIINSFFKKIEKFNI